MIINYNAKNKTGIKNFIDIKLDETIHESIMLRICRLVDDEITTKTEVIFATLILEIVVIHFELKLILDVS